MRRSSLNLLIDALATLVMLALIATGLVVRYTLPAGSGGHGRGGGLVLWGLDRHGWGDVHFWLAVAVGVLMVLHVALHWRWVCATIRHVLRRGEPAGTTGPLRSNLYGVGFVAAIVLLIGGFLLVARMNVETGEGGRSRAGRAVHSEHDDETHPRGGSDVRGSMTLRQVADGAGVRVDQLKEWLTLPASVGGDERLGRLKQAYGIEIADVRRVLADYAAEQSAETSAGQP
ncbi:MAG: DUF4405 domain-containing protein [Phycisphaerae bacterium]|nr:DUF4405 domain-containing protein [Phycisphaerae bacterium]